MLKMKKRTVAFCLIVLSLLLVIGCGKPVGDLPSETDSEESSDLASEESSSLPETEEETVTDCSHVFGESVIIEAAKPLRDGVARKTCTLCGEPLDEAIPATKSIKVLAIGNSFSVDAMQYLWDICRDGGVERIVLGNLYIGNCTLSTHLTNLTENKNAYTYYKNTNGSWTTTESKSIASALAEEEWDIVTLQQASGDSGIPSTYSPLPNILDFLEGHKPTEDTKLMWHMTWAYQSDSTHKSFPTYRNDQTVMYNMILTSLKSKIESNESFSGIIPTGTAIQNLRTSYIGDTVTRDGYHMNHSHGRYTAALTWYAYLTGGSLEAVDWVPSAYRSIADDLEVMREAVRNALVAPKEVTKSAMPELTDAVLLQRLGLNPEDYTLLDWKPYLHSYWNSQNGIGLVHAGNSSASNLKRYISSCLFRRDQLPVGAVIIVDAGYQYRPEAWVNESYKSTSSTRPVNVTQTAVLVDASWWGAYQIRGFNLSRVGASVDMTAADAAHFRIYVPTVNP